MGFELRRVGRSLGILLVFAIVGPLVVTAVFAFFFLLIGVPMLQLMLIFFDLESLRPWLSIAAFLLFMFTLVAAAPPSVIAGLAFAIASVYFGLNSLWTALAIVGILVLGVVIIGFIAASSESSPLLLPTVQGLRQGATLALFLAIPGALAASICWLASRPLHRTPSPMP
jgi:hypothetical protein